MLATAACLLALTLTQDGKTIFYLASDGQGYTSRHRLERSVIRDIKRLPSQSILWTSHPAVIRSLAGRGAALSPASPVNGAPSPRLSDGETAYLVWFGDEYPRRPRLLTPEQLQVTFEVTLCTEQHDGAVFWLCARRP